MTLDACLPESLRSNATSITRIAGGLSGAGVHRVDAAGRSYVLKVTSESTPIDDWRRSLAIQRRAAHAGLAPRVIHHDETRRAVLSELVANRGLMARLFDPQTRADAIRQLGETIGSVHALPIDADAMARDLDQSGPRSGPDSGRDPRALVLPTWTQLATFTLPTFARTTIDRVLAETPPAPRASVTSHNDLNPSNIVFDGARILFLDWDMAGPNDPFYDLAAAAMFLRLDDASASALIAAHDHAPPAPLPEGFRYARRLVAALCATMFFRIAQGAGHAGADTDVEAAPTLRDVHSRIAIGALAPNSADGAWAFALALTRTITDPT